MSQDRFYVRYGAVQVRPPFTGRERNPLRWSIKKWEFIVSYLEEHPKEVIGDGGFKTCALCAKYGCRSDEHYVCCSGCPVSNATSTIWCATTPYTVYSREANHGDHTGSLCSARAMVLFLQGLADTKES